MHVAKAVVAAVGGGVAAACSALSAGSTATVAALAGVATACGLFGGTYAVPNKPRP